MCCRSLVQRLVGSGAGLDLAGQTSPVHGSGQQCGCSHAACTTDCEMLLLLPICGVPQPAPNACHKQIMVWYFQREKIKSSIELLSAFPYSSVRIPRLQTGSQHLIK